MYKVEYLKSVFKDDISKLSKVDKKKIKKAIEEFLIKDPIRFSRPLHYNLKGCRRMRVQNYRIIFQVKEDMILIIKIGHRKEIYKVK